MQAVHVRIYGVVQGVFFRASTKEKALDLKITGWVRNCLDGSVEALFEGNNHQLNAMLAWCNHGSQHAQVDQVEIIARKDCTNQQESFNILYE